MVAATAPQTPRKPRKPFSVWRFLGYVVLILVALFYLMPLYVMIITGFKSAANVSLQTMWELPNSISAGGYREAWHRLSPNMATSRSVPTSFGAASSV